MHVELGPGTYLDGCPARRATLFGDDGEVAEYGELGDDDAQALGRLILKRPELLGKVGLVHSYESGPLDNVRDVLLEK